MPASYRIEVLSRCIFVTLEGSVTDEDLIEGQSNMYRDPLFDGSYPRFVDGTRVTKLLASADVVRSIATNATARGLRKVALVAKSDFIYAMMRMYDGYASANEAECYVSRDLNVRSNGCSVKSVNFRLSRDM